MKNTGWVAACSLVVACGSTGLKPEVLSTTSARLASKRYKLVAELLTHSEARARCEQLGGRLAGVQSDSEQSAAHAIAPQGGWLGLSDAQSEGQFTWATGAALEYSVFWYGEPNDAGGNEDCVAMTPEGPWNDLSCEARTYALCELTSAFPNWRQFAAVQRRPATGCIPTGYETLVRAAGRTNGVNLPAFQDDFDLDANAPWGGPYRNNFVSVADAVKARYPSLVFRAVAFGSGAEKLAFIESKIGVQRPTLLLFQ